MASAEKINPEILTWARETAGLSLDDAAENVGFASTGRLSAAEKLEEFENGERSPTRNQLAKFASVYRRPLVTFYLRTPPAKGVRGEDFRTSLSDVSVRENALLDALLRDVRARQEMVRSLLEDDDDLEKRTFVGSVEMSDGVEAVARAIVTTVGISEGSGRRNRTPEQLFGDLRAKIENIGVFVLLLGDLGSHHSAISESVFRGFAIADTVAPFIVINDQDAKAARPFTLLHELVHIWLGQTGVSGGSDAADLSSGKAAVERFCDDVASAVLIPATAFPSDPPDEVSGSMDDVQRFIARSAATWGVSEPAMAYRIRRMGWLTPAMHRELQSAYAVRWRTLKQKAKADARESEGGPSFYTVKQFKLGKALIEVVRRSVRSNDLSYTKAAKLLGVRSATLEPLLKRAESEVVPIGRTTGLRT